VLDDVEGIDEARNGQGSLVQCVDPGFGSERIVVPADTDMRDEIDIEAKMPGEQARIEPIVQSDDRRIAALGHEELVEAVA